MNRNEKCFHININNTHKSSSLQCSFFVFGFWAPKQYLFTRFAFFFVTGCSCTVRRVPSGVTFFVSTSNSSSTCSACVQSPPTSADAGCGCRETDHVPYSRSPPLIPLPCTLPAVSVCWEPSSTHVVMKNVFFQRQQQLGHSDESPPRCFDPRSPSLQSQPFSLPLV